MISIGIFKKTCICIFTLIRLTNISTKNRGAIMGFFILYLSLIFSAINFNDAETSEPKILKADTGSAALEVIIGDCETGGLPSACCSYWDVKVETETINVFNILPMQFVNWECTTGGELKCIGCNSEE